MTELENDSTIRAMILTGEGRSFVAGADIGEMSTLTKEGGVAFGKHGNDVFRAIGAMALSFLAWAFYNWLRLRFLAWRARRASANTSPSPSSPPASPAAR